MSHRRVPGTRYHVPHRGIFSIDMVVLPGTLYLKYSNHIGLAFVLVPRIYEDFTVVGLHIC